MTLKDIIPNSMFSWIGMRDTDSSQLETMLLTNLDVINEFNNLIISTTSLSDVDNLSILLEKYLSDKSYKHIKHPHTENRGHTFGTIDLEEMTYREVIKNPSIKYLWKSTQDVIITPEIFDTEIDNEDFFFLPGFSYETTTFYNDISDFIKNYEKKSFVPQTNFYIINIQKIEYIYQTKLYIDSIYDRFNEEKKRYPNIKPWELINDVKFDCETLLGNNVNNNQLITKNLLNESTFVDLYNYVRNFGIGDPSHKNIYFESVGVSHYHYYQENIVNI